MKHLARSHKILIGWLCLIFFTSCFVVPFDTFLRFIHRLNSSLAFHQWFDRLWIGDWFFVVKGWHMTEYAILVSLAVVALRRGRVGSQLSSIWLAFVLSVVFAASDEWHQTFVPGRDGNLGDVFIDTGGALLAALYWSSQQRRLNRKLSSERRFSGEA